MNKYGHALHPHQKQELGTATRAEPSMVFHYITTRADLCTVSITTVLSVFHNKQQPALSQYASQVNTA